MNHPTPDWELRLARLWARFNAGGEDDLLAQIETLTRELPPDNGIGMFERACAHDSTGHPDLAVPLYRAALEAGLTGLRRRRAVIQLASSQRNLGQAAEAACLLRAELHRIDPDVDAQALRGAVRAFLALALADLGQERAALQQALLALANTLPRYNRSLGRYAHALGGPGSTQKDPPRLIAAMTLAGTDAEGTPVPVRISIHAPRLEEAPNTWACAVEVTPWMAAPFALLGEGEEQCVHLALRHANLMLNRYLDEGGRLMHADGAPCTRDHITSRMSIDWTAHG
jgi:tetratricopeptide (TPR) repeat protein